MKGRMGSSLTTEIPQEEVSVQYTRTHKLHFHDQTKPFFSVIFRFSQLYFIEETFPSEQSSIVD